MSSILSGLVRRQGEREGEGNEGEGYLSLLRATVSQSEDISAGFNDAPQYNMQAAWWWKLTLFALCFISNFLHFGHDFIYIY